MPSPRRTRAPGERSRARILERAAALATIEGLDGLSVGRLAAAAEMPKSSVYALFGSKQELQLATVEAARASFTAAVVAPALTGAAPGRDRLRALCEAYVAYVERRVFPGGCFYVTAAAEMGARPGPVRGRVAAHQQQWRELLLAEARTAVARGELPPGTDAAQLAFELGALLAGADVVHVLHDDAEALRRVRAAIAERLGDPPPDGP